VNHEIPKCPVERLKSSCRFFGTGFGLWLRGGGGGGGGGGSPYVPALKFNDARNSQYLIAF